MYALRTFARQYWILNSGTFGLACIRKSSSANATEIADKRFDATLILLRLVPGEGKEWYYADFAASSTSSSLIVFLPAWSASLFASLVRFAM